MENNPGRVNSSEIRCVVFDFGFTLSSDLYFSLVPPDCPRWSEIIQERVFAEPQIVRRWMEGGMTIADIAGLLAKYVAMDRDSIVSTMEKGCEHMRMNPAVWDFALEQKSRGKKTALVTANMDVFTKVVVPAHRLDQVFDVIVNSFDYRDLHKEHLWPVAFQRLGGDVQYWNSLLIEDGETEPARFRRLGGQAYQYSTDELFLNWLHAIRWDQTTGTAGTDLPNALGNTI